MRLIYLSLFWLLGIYLGSESGLPLGIVLAALTVGSLFLTSKRRQSLLLFGLCLVALSCGIVRYQVEDTTPSLFYAYNDRGSVVIEGMVATDPEPRDKNTSFRLEDVRLKDGEDWQEASGAILVYAPKFPESGFEGRDFPYYRYGDRLKIEGELETPPELDGFDWQQYLASQGVYSIIHIYDTGNIELVASGQGSQPLYWIYSFRDKMSQSLDYALPQEPQNSLAQAITLGKRGTLPTELRGEFAETGTAHILAVSGLHLGIVAGIALSAGIWLFGRRRPTYFILALALIWFYAVLTGWHTPVFRAAIMGSLWLTADYIGRPRSAFTALLFAAAIMVAIQPFLLWDVSFQLSFAAMAGIVLLSPRFHALLLKAFHIPEGRGGFGIGAARFVIATVSITLGAILFTLPLIAYHFGYISVVGLPATFLILPALAGIIVSTALVGLIGLFAPPVAWVLGWGSWLFTTYTINTVHLFSILPFASFDIGVSAAAVWAYYIAFAAALWFWGNRMQLKRLTRK
jgi:competence protein ComEC